jgi:hypothetical protein
LRTVRRRARRHRPGAAAGRPTRSLAVDDRAHDGRTPSAWIFWVSSTRNSVTRRRPRQLAGIAHLAAGLGVERRVVEHHHARVAGARRIDRRAVRVQRDDPRLVRCSVS